MLILAHPSASLLLLGLLMLLPPLPLVSPLWPGSRPLLPDRDPRTPNRWLLLLLYPPPPPVNPPTGGCCSWLHPPSLPTRTPAQAGCFPFSDHRHRRPPHPPTPTTTHTHTRTVAPGSTHCHIRPARGCCSRFQPPLLPMRLLSPACCPPPRSHPELPKASPVQRHGRPHLPATAPAQPVPHPAPAPPTASLAQKLPPQHPSAFGSATSVRVSGIEGAGAR